jgi:hypothetical protein
VNKHLQNLISLSNLDKELDSFGDREISINTKVNTLILKRDELNKLMTNQEEALREIVFKKDKNNILIKDFNHQLKEKEKKYTLLKTEKELKNWQIEEDLLKENITNAISEVEKCENIEVATKDKLSQLKLELQSIDLEITTAQDEVKDEITKLFEDKDKFYNQRDELSRSINSGVLSFYEKIKRWAGNTAIVSVRKQACMGCFMLLNDKTYSNVIKSEDIITCPSCGRILYIDA